jgi:hypothetical protein
MPLTLQKNIGKNQWRNIYKEKKKSRSGIEGIL